MASPSATYVASVVEAQLLSTLVSAETLRQGADELLRGLAQVLDDASAAIAVRDRDGLTLHVLAEIGHAAWPEVLAPQFAVGGQPGVDAGTETLVVPLRAQGTVVGALLLADTRRGLALLGDGSFPGLVDTTAEVLRALTVRTEAEIRRRAHALRSLDSVVVGMAHQIANPLTGASAIAQLLIEELPDAAQRAAVRQVDQEMQRAVAVLRDLLELHRDTMARDGLIDLGEFAERILRFRAYTIREQGIALDVETAPVLLPVRADARELEHAILLALRSAELRSRGSMNRSIAVRVQESAAGEPFVEITDSGAGDVPVVQPAYFDLPLTAPERPAPEDESPDLGLVDGILRACGGRLEVSGSKTAGTSLVLVLPRAASPGRASAPHLPKP